MSVNRIVRSVRASDALEIVDASHQSTFFTLTTSDVCSCVEIRKRWRMFRHRLFTILNRSGIRPLYIMNFELHPGYLLKVKPDSKTSERIIHGTGKSHGWHIHGVISIPLTHDFCRDLLTHCGFARSNFKPVTSHGVSEYLTKHALKAYVGLSRKERQRYSKIRFRLVNTSRGLPPLHSYSWQSTLISKTRDLRNLWSSRLHEVGLKYRDFRLLHQRAEVCSILGFSEFDQLCSLHSLLSHSYHPQLALSICSQNANKNR